MDLAPYVGRSPGFGDELNLVPTDEHALHKAVPKVFVFGDAARSRHLPISSGTPTASKHLAATAAVRER